MRDASPLNTGYTYRIPSTESQAQNLFTLISQNDHPSTIVMRTQNLPDLSTVLQNELNSIDLSVYELQLVFIRSLLPAPFAGVVNTRQSSDPDRLHFRLRQHQSHGQLSTEG